MKEDMDHTTDNKSAISLKKLLMILLAIIGGEVALVLLTTVAQEVLFDGISYRQSPIFDLVVGGAATILAAVLSGLLARLICKETYATVPVVISILIAIETTYLISRGVTGDPVWFDILAGLSLIAGIWIGFYMLNWIRKPEQK
jgi:hypothetical protein